MKACVYCACEIEDSATFCPYCGTDQIPNSRMCPSCGRILLPRAVFCPGCGTKQFLPPDARTKAADAGRKLIEVPNCSWLRAGGFFSTACTLEIYGDKLLLLGANGQSLLFLNFTSIMKVTDNRAEQADGRTLQITTVQNKVFRLLVPPIGKDFVPYIRALLNAYSAP